MQAITVPEVPDSTRAWVVAVAAFIVGFVVFGILYSFGSFFDAINKELDASNIATSAFFAIIGLAFYLCGPLCGYLGDRFGPRLLISTGAFLATAGLILTSQIETIWAGYMTYGIGVGLGCACAYTPSLAVVGGWFVRQRSAALGVAASGTGCGMLVAPPLVSMLIADFGWRQACVLLGWGSGVLLLIAAGMVRSAPLATTRVARSLKANIYSAPFILLYLSWICATTGLFIPFVFLPAFAHQKGASPLAGSILLSLIGITSVIGRLGFGLLASRIGTVWLFKAAVLLMAASYILWLSSPTYACLVIFSILLGLGYGVRIALMPEILIVFFGVANLGALLGLFFTSSGVAAVLGPLVAALIVDHIGNAAWGVSFALLMGWAGFAALLPLRQPSAILAENRAIPTTP
jgi:MFS family permease